MLMPSVVKPVSYVVEMLKSQYFFLIQTNKLASEQDKKYLLNVNILNSFLSEIQEQIPKNEDKYLGALSFRFNFKHRNVSAEYCMFWSRVDISPLIRKLDVSYAMISPSWEPLRLYSRLSKDEKFFFKVLFLEGDKIKTDKPFEVYPFVEKELLYGEVVDFIVNLLKDRHGLREVYVDVGKLIKKADLHNRVTRLFSKIFGWKNLKYEDEVKISHLLRKHSNVLLNRKIPAIMFYPKPRHSSDEKGISVVLNSGKIVNLDYWKTKREVAKNFIRVLMRKFETMSKKELKDFVSSFYLLDPSIVSIEHFSSKGDGRVL